MKKYWILLIAFTICMLPGAARSIPYTDNGINLRYMEDKNIPPAKTQEIKSKGKGSAINTESQTNVKNSMTSQKKNKSHR